MRITHQIIAAILFIANLTFAMDAPKTKQTRRDGPQIVLFDGCYDPLTKAVNVCEMGNGANSDFSRFDFLTGVRDAIGKKAIIEYSKNYDKIFVMTSSARREQSHKLPLSETKHTAIDTIVVAKDESNVFDYFAQDYQESAEEMAAPVLVRIREEIKKSKTTTILFMLDLHLHERTKLTDYRFANVLQNTINTTFPEYRGRFVVENGNLFTAALTENKFFYLSCDTPDIATRSLDLAHLDTKKVQAMAETMHPVVVKPVDNACGKGVFVSAPETLVSDINFASGIVTVKQKSDWRYPQDLKNTAKDFCSYNGKPIDFVDGDLVTGWLTSKPLAIWQPLFASKIINERVATFRFVAIIYPNDEVVSLGGVWELARGKMGEADLTSSIVTTTAPKDDYKSFTAAMNDEDLEVIKTDLSKRLVNLYKVSDGSVKKHLRHLNKLDDSDVKSHVSLVASQLNLVAMPEEVTNTWITSYVNRWRSEHPRPAQKIEKEIRHKQMSRSLTSGFQHSCAIDEDWRAKCWGDNEYGQASVPDHIGPIREIAAGGHMTCAVSIKNEVFCWGKDFQEYRNALMNWSGRYFDNFLSEGGTIKSISVGIDHMCASRWDKGIFCVGSNDHKQVEVPSWLASSNIKAISVGSDHSCALLPDDKVTCWGSNALGQRNTPMDMPRAKSLISGSDHNCIITTDDAALCWGSNEFGQSEVPQNLPAVTMLAANGAEGFTTCAITVDNNGICWGREDYARYDLTNIRTIAVGGFHLCVTRMNGVVECFGNNDERQTDVPRQFQKELSLP